MAGYLAGVGRRHKRDRAISERLSSALPRQPPVQVYLP